MSVADGFAAALRRFFLYSLGHIMPIGPQNS